MLALESEGATAGAPPRGRFLRLEEAPTASRCSPLVAELRARGLAADLDYAGRSLKGQMTQAGRSGAATSCRPENACPHGGARRAERMRFGTTTARRYVSRTRDDLRNDAP